MKSKVIGILVIMLIVMLPVSVFAYGGIYTNISIGGTDAAQSSVAVTNRIVGVLQVAGTIISVIALIIIGMRYMLSSVEEKAQMKGVIGYYIIGCVLVFATSNVLGFAYTVVDDVKHEWVLDSYKDPNCIESGYVTNKCSKCQETYTSIKPALGHDYGEPVQHSATCIEGAYTTKICKRCDDVHRVNTTAALEHDWEEVSRTAATCEANGTITYVCKRDSNHKDTDNTTLIAKGHTPVTDAAVQKTCTTDGKTAGSHCSVCNKVLVPQAVIAKGHTEETIPGKAATCIATGLTDGKKCSVCGLVTGEQKPIALTAHTEETVAAVAATCGTTGLTAGKRCSVCGVVTEPQETIPAGHPPSSIITFYLKEKGKTVHGIYEACKDCGYPTVTDSGNCDGSKGFLGMGKKACTICGLKDDEGRMSYSFVLTSHSHIVYVDWNESADRWWRWEQYRS